MHGRLAVTRVSISIESDISVDNLYFCIYEEIIFFIPCTDTAYFSAVFCPSIRNKNDR